MLQTIVSWAGAHKRLVIGAVAAVVLMVLGWQVFELFQWRLHPRSTDFFTYYSGTQPTQQALTSTRQPCEGAPFILPAEGYIGLVYGDPRGPYSQARPHQGVDVFAPEPGITPIYAAYDGFLTRERGWTSSVIIRVPADPLKPERQIWLYYTHMADVDGNSYIAEAYPRGTRDAPISQGEFIGYIGDYNGGSARTVSPHLHFSIVLGDGAGGYRNELEFTNTVDPSPYLNMPVNYTCAPPGAIMCTAEPLCEGMITSGNAP